MYGLHCEMGTVSTWGIIEFQFPRNDCDLNDELKNETLELMSDKIELFIRAIYRGFSIKCRGVKNLTFLPYRAGRKWSASQGNTILLLLCAFLKAQV